MGFAPGQTIADVQMAAYPAGDSYYAGAVVTVSGVITALPPDVEDRTDPEALAHSAGFRHPERVRSLEWGIGLSE